MIGEWCELCEAYHEEDNPVVLDEEWGRICLDCVGRMEDWEEEDEQA